MQFHLLSFEGPDLYARAGGISTRVVGLAEALAERGLDTHLWFIGDPSASGVEQRGHLTLHRWCQWISAYAPLGVYQQEEAKERDFAASLPPHLMKEILGPHLAGGGEAVVLAEEWHTAHAAIHLDWLLRQAGLRERAVLVWTANNWFGFERVDWPRLSAATQIATVSHYMRRCMDPLGVDPIVIPNGLSAEAFVSPDPGTLEALRRVAGGRTVLAKIARWDPDKSWLASLDVTRMLKQRGARPLLLARGGREAYGEAVLAHARSRGLVVSHQRMPTPGVAGLLGAVAAGRESDIVVLESHVNAEARGALLRGADVVLANSRHEPFGLVGLETMALGGIACTGATGEEYARAGENALVIPGENPGEFIAQFDALLANAGRVEEMRRAAHCTARQYTWPRVIGTHLLPFVGRFGGFALEARWLEQSVDFARRTRWPSRSESTDSVGSDAWSSRRSATRASSAGRSTSWASSTSPPMRTTSRTR
jgi:glycosyltransferase involved in cell wall biosynthesis